jgi:hypothetical protein
VRAFTERVDLNYLLHSGNIVAPKFDTQLEIVADDVPPGRNAISNCRLQFVERMAEDGK